MAGPVPSQIDVDTLHRMRQAGGSLTILDVREPWVVVLCVIDGSVTIPLGSLPRRAAELPGEGRIVVACKHGMRSAEATAWLRHNGFPSAINLHGGIDAWARQIDPTMK